MFFGDDAGENQRAQERALATGRAGHPTVASEPALDNSKIVATSLDAVFGRSERDLLDVHGFGTKAHSDIHSVLRGSSFDLSKATPHQVQLTKIFIATQWQKGNFGEELKNALGVLAKNPQIIADLERIATADTLFGVKKTSENASRFEEQRREFLGDLLRAVVDTKAITQGPDSLCTVTSMLKMLPATELTRLAAGMAVDNSVVTRGGRELQMLPGFAEYSAQAADGLVSTIKCRRPSEGMLNLIQAVGHPDMTPTNGAYWDGYTRTWEALSGHRAACAARDAKDILVDQASGRAVLEDRPGVSKMTQMEYLDHALSAATLNGQRGGVIIDTKWDHARAGQASDGGAHARHMLKVLEKCVVNGQEVYKVENPIGGYVENGRYVAEGTIMGNQHDKSGFWFANGKEPGIVYIRKDVLERNIQTLIVDYDEPFSEQSAEAVLSIGKEGLEGGVNQAIINFVKGDDIGIGGNNKVALNKREGLRYDAQLASDTDKPEPVRDYGRAQQEVARSRRREEEDSQFNLNLESHISPPSRDGTSSSFFSAKSEVVNQGSSQATIAPIAEPLGRQGLESFVTNAIFGKA